MSKSKIFLVRESLENSIIAASRFTGVADAADADSTFRRLYDRAKAEYLKRGASDKAFVFEQTKATHFGYVNNNMSLYPVRHAHKSAKSWISPFGKPVVTNHDLYQDPLGRHVAAEYLPFDIPQNRMDDLNTPKGVIVTHSVINDEDGMDKVLDGRYLTVSVSARSNELKCSICGTNWLEEACDHRPGNFYKVENEDKKSSRKLLCYKESGALEYLERSFVNNPADRGASHYAGVTNYELIMPEDSIQDEEYIVKNMLYSKESPMIVDSSGYTLFIAQDNYGNTATGKPVYAFSFNDYDLSGIASSNITDQDDEEDEDEKVDPPAGDTDGDLNQSSTIEPLVQFNIDGEDRSSLLPSDNLDSKSSNIDPKVKEKETVNYDSIPVKDAIDKIPGLKAHIDSLVADAEAAQKKEFQAAIDEATETKSLADAKVKEVTDALTAVSDKAKKIAVDSIISLIANLKKPQYTKLADTFKDNEEGFTGAITELRDKYLSRSLDSLQDTLEDLQSEKNTEAITTSSTQPVVDGQGAMDGITDGVTTEGNVEDNSTQTQTDNSQAPAAPVTLRVGRV